MAVQDELTAITYDIHGNIINCHPNRNKALLVISDAPQFRLDQDNIVRGMVTFTNSVIFRNVSDNRWDVGSLTALPDLASAYQKVLYLNGLSRDATRAIGGQ